MHFQWIFIFLLVSCWITPEETMASWEMSSLLSNFAHGDHESEPETAIERSLSRRKRATGVTEYTVDIEISFPDPSFANRIKQFIAKNLTFPIPLGINDTEITSINVTTACNRTGSNVQCSCESGHIWPDAVCTSYSKCPGSSASSCDCITGSSIPAQYCRPKAVSIKLSIRVHKDYTKDLKDPKSATYREYKRDLEAQFAKAYNTLAGIISATVTNFRPGSVVADYTVVTEPVSPSALTIANQNLLDYLRTANYSADPVITVVNDQSFITVSPSSIFNKDTVNLNCTVNISSYTRVAWLFNDTEVIQNTSYTTTTGLSTVQSILTISLVSLNNGGTYLCIVDNNSTSYQTETTIVVQPLEITVLNTNVSCNNVEVPIIECCTQGLSMDFFMTCAVKAGIPGIARNNTPCKTYTVSADEKKCAGFSTGSYDCTCSTMNGANEARNVKVSYQGSYGVTVNSKKDIISESRELTVQCNCNATSVQTISWYFQEIPVPKEYYTTTNLTTCSSTLTIPSNTTTVAWSGTYVCSVDAGSNGVVSGSKQISVAKLIKPKQININPVSSGFQCGKSIDFSCCISNTTGYKNAVLQIVTDSGTSQQAMKMTNQCFETSYTPDASKCVNFKARCDITNEINDTVSSDSMELRHVTNVKCNKTYIGKIDSVVVVSCRDDNPTLTGTKNLTCIGNESGADWKLTDFGCVSAALDNIKNQLEDLTSPTAKKEIPVLLANLSSTVNREQDNVSSSTNNIQLVVDLLRKVNVRLDEVKTTVMENFLNIADIVVGNTATWNRFSPDDRIAKSSGLLQSVEEFAGKLSINGSVNITNNRNIQLSGNIVNNILNDYTAYFDFNRTENLTGNVLINKNNLTGLSLNATIVSVAYATLKDILYTNSSNSSTQKVINGLVMTTMVTDNRTGFQIGMNFRKKNQTLNKATCVFWNFSTQDWDSTDCRPEDINDSAMVRCVCDHLTSFSILMSYNDNGNPNTDETLAYITYIGLSISILSLVICIIIEAMVWKSVTKNKTSYMRHVCIMNIAVTLLMADVWFIIGSRMSETGKTDVCVAATFFTHLFYLCTFFWMLTMGLILFYRLMCVFHDLSKTVMMGISFFLGYGCPIIISVITVGVTQPSNRYTTGKACWLNREDSNAFLAFIIPALSILLVNFVTLFVVIIKVLRPSVGDNKPKKEEKSSLNHIAKCILILTPLLGLTWGFGIGTLFSNNEAINGIFSALNALQGLFILLFGCLMDKKVRDALFSRFSVSRWSSQQTKTSNLSSSDPTFSKGFINLFAKKGVYNISSAQASSSSEASNSYSLLS